MSILYNDKSGATPQEILLAGNANTDQILNGTSKNAIANKAVYNALQEKIEKSVNDLIYYYTKNDTYNKTEVRQLIGAINTLTIEVVAALPTSEISTTTIYFVGPAAGTNTYDEYVYVNNTWVKIGDTDIDLSDYLEIADFNVAIADYYTKAEIDLMIAGYYNKTQVDTALAAKQDTLTFDTVPTSGSSNPITSGGVYNALQTADEDIWEAMSKNGAKNKLPFDNSHMRAINGGGTWNTNTYTYNGITYTLNSNGTITVNGTATAYSIFRIIDSNSYNFKLDSNETYYLTGSPATGSSSSTYYVYYSELIGGTWTYYINYGTGDTQFTPNASATQVVVDIIVRDGQSISSQIFKPMIRLTSDPDSTYQPYAMTNQQMTPYVQAISNPNLLDNPWFTVNQRGNTFYQTENGYCVDRWILGKGAFTARETNAPYGVLQTRVANTNGWLRQKTEFELDTTKPITYSAIISASVTSDYGFALKFSNMDDYNDSKMKWFPTTANKKILVYFTDLPFKNTAFEVVANAGASSTVKIYALKAELGTVSTLAMDSAPNYQQELAKCQRYFQRIKGNSVNKVRLLFGLVSTTTTIQAQIPFVVPMRINNATITYSTNGILYGKTSSTTTVASGINSSDPSSSMCRNCLVTGTSLTVGDVMPIYLDVGAYIDLSADL